MERQIEDMTLRILKDRSAEARQEPAAVAAAAAAASRQPRRMPYDPVTDRDDTPEDLRTSVLKSRADSEGRRLLDTLPVRRAWKGHPLEQHDDASRATAFEAIMVYERGQVQGPQQQCSRCRRGQGLSPECIKVQGVRDGACSNCLLSRIAAGHGRTSPSRDYSPARRFISASNPSTAKEDMVAVWNVIAGVLATQPRDCCAEVEEATTPARRIEDAALLVARSADAWGHAVEDGEESGKKRPRTEEEKAKLVTQASRIRDTAVRIAESARAWGEKQAAARSQTPPAARS